MLTNNSALATPVIIFAMVSSCGSLAVPSWAKINTQRLDGPNYTVVCSGEGPSIDIARNTALGSCTSSAGKQLQTTVAIQSITIETERDASFHQEVTSNEKYSGLNCEPLQEAIEERDNQTQVWLKCKFDLRKAKVQNLDEMNSVAKSGGIKNQASPDENRSVSDSTVQLGKHTRGREQLVSIAVVPRCTSIIVRGVQSRSVECQTNPISVRVLPGDRELLVRARGYRPKSILVESFKESYDVIQVILEPL